MNLEIVYRSPAELRSDPRNPRTHSKKQINQICRSIQTFEFVSPVLADDAGMIIAGHGRVRASKQLGLDRIPVIVLSHLTDAQKRALCLADNRIPQNAGWDADLLKAALEDLSLPQISFDLPVLAFSSAEIDALLSPNAPDSADDELPSERPVPRARPGDIFMAGDHVIGCGDARDEAFVRRVMRGACADMAFLDAPYNVSIEDHATRRSGHREFAMASGEMTKTDYSAFLTDALGVAAKASRDGAVHFLCMDWRHLDQLMSAAAPLYGVLLNLCVWRKSNAGLGSLYRSQHELVPVYRVGPAKHFNAIQLGRHGRHRTNIWDYPSVTSPRGSRRQDLELHPTTKPVAMIADAIKDVTRRGDVVLDTFLGAGSTLIAAERTGRRCRAVEIDPTYVDVALDRWAALTGLEPVRLPVRGRHAQNGGDQP